MHGPRGESEGLKYADCLRPGRRKQRHKKLKGGDFLAPLEFQIFQLSARLDESEEKPKDMRKEVACVRECICGESEYPDSGVR